MEIEQKFFFITFAKVWKIIIKKNVATVLPVS